MLEIEVNNRMKLEPFEKKDGYRVWLSEEEQEQLINYYKTETRKQLAIRLMLHGLRSDEVPRVSVDDFRRMDTEEEGWMLTIRESKTGFRECPVSASLVDKAKTVHNVSELKKGEPLVDVSKRTVQRYVTRAANELAQDDWDWSYVSAHDLRRSWATHLYWKLSGSRAKDVVLAFGGWQDIQTFNSNYLGAIPDSIAIEVMDEAEIN